MTPHSKNGTDMIQDRSRMPSIASVVKLGANIVLFRISNVF